MKPYSQLITHQRNNLFEKKANAVFQGNGLEYGLPWIGVFVQPSGCMVKWVIIGSNNGLLPVWCIAII